jgi:hypothetical protein
LFLVFSEEVDHTLHGTLNTGLAEATMAEWALTS